MKHLIFLSIAIFFVKALSFAVDKTCVESEVGFDHGEGGKIQI